MIFGLSPLAFFFNYFYYLELLGFMMLMLKRRYSMGLTIGLGLVFSFLLIVTANLFPRFTALRLAMLPIQLSVYGLLVFRDKPARTLFVAWVLPVVMVLVEFLGIAFLFPPEVLYMEADRLPLGTQFLCWANNFVSTGILCWFVTVMLNRLRNRLSLREMLMYLLFPASQLFLLYGWLNGMRLGESADRHSMVAVVMLVCCCADAGIFASMYKLSQKDRVEKENHYLSNQIRTQEIYYRELAAQHETIHAMRRDIDRHIACMEEMLSAGRTEEAAAYVSGLQMNSGDGSLGICEHPVADAFLHDVMRIGEERGIKVEASVSLPADIALSDTDLVCTLGNLLDNAFEACEGIEAPVIRVKGALFGEYLVIETENPVSGTPSERKNAIPGLERGVGSRVLADLAHKYSGSFAVRREGNLFRAEITYHVKG